MSLLDGVVAAVAKRASSADPAESAAASSVAEFFNLHRADAERALARFGADGRLLDGAVLPASAFNDFYKWTMYPVISAVQRAPASLFHPHAAGSTAGRVVCTFSANVRHAEYRRALLESATGRAPPHLFKQLCSALESLAHRPFDRDVFERAVADMKLPNWGTDVLDAVCGAADRPRMLVDEVVVDLTRSSPAEPSHPDNVLVQVFVAPDNRLNEERLHIEATGPWHRVTWLETTLMQAIYETLLRDRMRSRSRGSAISTESGSEALGGDEQWYPEWLAAALTRCARSAAAAARTGMRGIVMTGRRTGGMAMVLLQNLYLQHALRDTAGAALLLGTSSVTAHYWLLSAGVDPALVPNIGGTHAHELSMVLGALLSHVDDEAGVPLSQTLGHALYFHLSSPQGDVRDPVRKALMPMLPDTLGSRAFMRVASRLRVARGPHRGEPLLGIFGAARQDSGTHAGFAALMREFGFQGTLMASEIEVAEDLESARQQGYSLYGAGGFFGDSEAAWDPSVKNISMAIKVLRVYVDGQRSLSDPVKTGDPSDAGSGEGKFEADGLLCQERLKALRCRTERLAAAELAVPPERLQAMFEALLDGLLGPEGTS